MSSVYTEARAQSKALKERTDAAKARAEEKRDLDEAKVGLTSPTSNPTGLDYKHFSICTECIYNEAFLDFCVSFSE